MRLEKHTRYKQGRVENAKEAHYMDCYGVYLELLSP